MSVARKDSDHDHSRPPDQRAGPVDGAMPRRPGRPVHDMPPQDAPVRQRGLPAVLLVRCGARGDHQAGSGGLTGVSDGCLIARLPV